MLKITIEVIPYGDYSDRHTIHSIYVANVGGNITKADYDTWFEIDPTDFPKEKRPVPHLKVKKHKRNQGAIELLRKVLNLWYTKKNKEAKDDKS